MSLYSYNNIFDERVSVLLERLHRHIDDFQSSYFPLYKFNTLVLTAEVYEITRLYATHREDYLSDYFGERTIRQCLERVVEIEELQERFQSVHSMFCIRAKRIDVSMSRAQEEESEGRYKDYSLLHDKGLDGFCEREESERKPSITHSLLWNASQSYDKQYKFGKLFSRAKETLGENSKNLHSSDPETRAEIRAYRSALHHRELENHVALRAISPESYDCTEYADRLKSIDYIIDFQKKSDEIPIDAVCSELNRALEILRNVFMTDAEDILYIRTGDFSRLEGLYDENVINYLYTELPFRKYYEAKDFFTEQLTEEIAIDLEEWRIRKELTGRRLHQEEYDKYYNKRKDNVIKNMKSYKKLWELRMLSGGLDVCVTPENFARMFYRRKGVDRYFIELQWELEELNRLIDVNKSQPSIEELSTAQSPEQKAVADFVDTIYKFVSTAYERWNNKRVSPGVNKPEVLVVIKKEELIGYIQNKVKNDFDELCSLCYPQTSKSKQNVCQFFVQLRDEGYFGSLPNKHLADILAPFVGLKVGTVTNYLSKT